MLVLVTGAAATASTFTAAATAPACVAATTSVATTSAALCDFLYDMSYCFCCSR